MRAKNKLGQQHEIFFGDAPQIQANKDLKILSLFSGCGGMDLGFEGGFICHKKSVNADKNWISEQVSENWVRLNPTRFQLCFANDIAR